MSIPHDPQELSRRQVLASAFALGATSLLSAEPIWAAPANKMAPGTIDVHNHFYPPVLAEETAASMVRIFGEVPARIKNWSPANLIETLDRNGVAKAVVCASSRPAGPRTDPAGFRIQTRSVNDYGAKMVQDYPKRFAQFGFLPMPDVEGSLREIEYALDTLKAPGIGMMTSYGNRWQGHPEFDPVLAELDRRKAVVFCHPLPAACCTNLFPDSAPREPQLLEFPYDTGRAVTSLLMSGSFAKFPNIRWIFCHCGGVIPTLSGRMRNVLRDMPAEQVAKITPKGIDYELRRQFYDTADAAYAPSMAAIRSYIPNTQIMFGTDYPLVEIDRNVEEIHARHLPQAEMLAIQRGNVLRLMPQLAS